MKQIILFGQPVFQVSDLRKNQKKWNGKKKPAPWDGICHEACWNAHEERCVCKCGGTNHGKGITGNFSRLEDFDEKEVIS